MIDSTEIQDHLQIHANGTCRTPGLDCINVRMQSDFLLFIHALIQYILCSW